jgi:thiol-disulfide isomerase/thioredoxin
MRQLLVLLFLFPMLVTAQTSLKNTAASNKKVVISCRFLERPANIDSFFLYETVGLGSRIVGRSTLRTSDSAFVFSVPASATPRQYGIGASNPAVYAKIWVSDEPEMTLWGNFAYLEKSRTVGSAVNRSWEAIQKRIDGFRAISDNLAFKFREASQNGNGRAVATEIEQHNKNKKAYIDSLKATNNSFARLAGLHIAPDFKGDKGYEDMADFMGRESFSNVNLSDAYFNDQPEVYSAFRQYASRLAMVLVTSERMQKIIDAQLATLPKGSKTYRMALGGIISGMKEVGHLLAPVYTQKYVEMFRKDQTYGEVRMMEYELSKNRTSTIGMEAPELTGKTPDGATYSLSQLRGKITLIDFWASWCGPCRRENPNVVQMYNKYHSKGFDILGVSLDSDGERWKAAIQQDGLPWHHISDLGGWQSQHAALYSVNSIPTTLLLDQQGRILARNLRGEQLGQKLREIFGE